MRRRQDVKVMVDTIVYYLIEELKYINTKYSYLEKPQDRVCHEAAQRRADINIITKIAETKY